MYDWRDELDDVFDLRSGATQDLASEYLVSLSLAITVNLKYERPYMEMIETYKDIWASIAAEYEAQYSHYVVENCKSGAPHIHGTMTVKVHSNAYYNYSETELLRMFAKSIFVKLPKKYYKQFGKAKINEFFRIFDSPAVYLKIPKVLSEGWEIYKHKNAGASRN